MWNEHVPRIPDVGPNFAWARKIQRMAIFSFKEAAAYIQNEPKIKENKAIGGPSAIFTWGIQSGGESLMRRLGFTILPYRNPLGRFGEFWENFYTWLLIWTFNAPSSRQRKLWLMKRSEIWMSASEFLRRYGYPSNPI